MNTFEMEYKQAKSEYRQGYAFIYLNSEVEKEEVRKLNMARLEELWERAEEDARLQAKDYYKIQMKNIDMVNKTAGLYEPDEVKTEIEDEYTITIGKKKE